MKKRLIPLVFNQFQLHRTDGELTGATWAIDGNGRAYNTPTLGAELLASWTALALESFSSSGKDITFMENTASAGIARHAISFAVGGWYFVLHNFSTASGDRPFMFAGNSSSGTGSNELFFNGFSDGSSVTSFRNALSTHFGYRYSSVFGSASTTCSLKQITASTQIATTLGTPNQTPLAKVYTITTGTQAGVIGWLDDTDTPANFAIAYHNGTTAKLDKCVAGTYTDLINVPSTFVQDAVIEIRRPSGNTFQLWYNGSQVGTDQTINDTAIADNATPHFGLFSTYSGNTFTLFTLGGNVVSFGF